MPKPPTLALARPGRRTVLAAAASLAGGLPAPRRARAQGDPVDVALVLAVDVSRSVDEEEARLQREGYRTAVSDPKIVEAVRGGMVSALALAYVEWAGIEYQRLVLSECPYEPVRRVIDVSGDGVNNSGPPAEEARDRAVAEGITINGLPIVNDRPTFGRLPPVPLDDYYRDSVVGGPGAFVVVADDFESFGVAVRRKLIREISALPRPPAAG